MVLIPVSEDLVLRTYRAEDAAGLYAAVDQNRARLHPWLDWVDKTVKLEHSLQFIEQTVLDQDQQEALALGIFYKGQVAGGVGMHHWMLETRKAEIGYWISEELEGKGIMNQCLSSFIDFLFEKIGLNKIEIHFVPGNVRSGRTAARLGFKTEGVIRQSVLRNGLPEDLVITGLLKREWKKG